MPKIMITILGSMVTWLEGPIRLFNEYENLNFDDDTNKLSK